MVVNEALGSSLSLRIFRGVNVPVFVCRRNYLTTLVSLSRTTDVVSWLPSLPAIIYLFLIISHIPFVSYVITNNKNKYNSRTPEADAMLYTSFLKISIKLALLRENLFNLKPILSYVVMS